MMLKLEKILLIFSKDVLKFNKKKDLLGNNSLIILLLNRKIWGNQYNFQKFNKEAKE